MFRLRHLLPLALLLFVRLAAAQGVQDLEVGVLPNLSTRILMTQYSPLRDYLARTLHRPVRVSTAPDWARFTRRGLDGDYDVVVTAAHLARLLQVDAGLVPVGRFTPDITALLIARSDTPVTRLADLRGKTLTLPNLHSLVALQTLRRLADLGLHPGSDLTVITTPRDDSVGNLLLRGEATAAALSAGEFRTIPEDIRRQLKTVQPLTDVPGFIVLAAPRLGTDDIDRLRQALAAFPASSEGQRFAELTGFTGLIAVDATLMKSLDVHLPDARRLVTEP